MNPNLLISSILLLIIGLAVLGTMLANGYRFIPTYRVTYAPADSRHPNLPVQRYNVIGHPVTHKWTSAAGNAVFTAIDTSRDKEYLTFRFSRVRKVRFSGFAVLSPEGYKAHAKTLTAQPAAA